MRTVCLAALAAAAMHAGDAEGGGRPWLRHPAVSPDGARIAFSHAGQIWIVPAAGGEAAPLTDGMYYSTAPVWSPDGSRIAFASTRHGNADVFAMPAAGGPVQRLTWHSADDTPMAFSPDGSEVYVASSRLGSPQADALEGAKGLGLPIIEQLYAVPAAGGRSRLVLATPALDVRPSRDGKRLLYTNHASIENPWRKHHVSSAARDVWVLDLASGVHTRLTSDRAEDRNPVWSPDERDILWLSERSGSFNVWRQPLGGGEARQVTSHQQYPVRFLTAAGDGSLVYGWNGEIWRLPTGTDVPVRVPVAIRQARLDYGASSVRVDGQATELVVSPDGGELAIVARGEVFVVSTASGATRRITDTPAAERGVSFSPDGRTLIYASERNGTWDIFQAALRRPEDAGFTGASPYTETLLVGGPGDSFQPIYAPDGAHVAYREDRNSIRVLDVAAGSSVEVLPQDAVYSYSDEDLSYAWSPDSRWLVTRTGFVTSEIELIDARGREPRRNVSQSGFGDLRPSVSADGGAILWLSDRVAHRAADASSTEVHVFAGFLTQEAFDAYRASPDERLRLEAAKAKAGPAKAAPAPATLPAVDSLPRRTVQLTPFPADLLFYRLTPDGQNLVIVTGSPDGMLGGYVVDVHTQAARQIFTRPPAPPLVFSTDREVKTLYALGDGSIDRYVLGSGQSSAIPFAAEMARDAHAEIAAIFEHAWRLTQTKFYRPDLHGVDWTAVGDNYRAFLPGVAHWEELAEILSEMAGELNASHQGSSYRADQAGADATASLGIYLDDAYRGPGQRIAEIIPGGPADRNDSALRPGAVILAVDGAAIAADDSLDRHLNRKAGTPVLLAIRPADGGATVEQTATPVDHATETSLAYARWVARRQAMVERLSQGRIGYVHLSHMDLESYLRAYSDLFGRYRQAEAVLVDIRFNGGGNLHDQLISTLTGEHHSDLVTRYGVAMERIPISRWARPSAVLANASSYSDGSVFPALYQRQRIGAIIGETVPGTGTAVIWEPQLEPRLVYGVPQIGFRAVDGSWFENQDIVPEIPVPADAAAIAAGHDRQLERAVAHLLEQIAKPAK